MDERLAALILSCTDGGTPPMGTEDWEYMRHELCRINEGSLVEWYRQQTLQVRGTLLWLLRVLDVPRAQCTYVALVESGADRTIREGEGSWEAGGCATVAPLPAREKELADARGQLRIQEERAIQAEASWEAAEDEVLRLKAEIYDLRYALEWDEGQV